MRKSKQCCMTKKRLRRTPWRGAKRSQEDAPKHATASHVCLLQAHLLYEESSNSEGPEANPARFFSQDVGRSNSPLIGFSPLLAYLMIVTRLPLGRGFLTCEDVHGWMDGMSICKSLQSQCTFAAASVPVCEVHGCPWLTFVSATETAASEGRWPCRTRNS